MDDSESIPQDVREPANSCRQSVSLGAYYDGELDAASSARMEQHLAGCEECRAELEEMRELSSLANNIGAAGISKARLNRIHRLVDTDQGYSVLRIAGVLTGLAASAAVIGAVWLSEIPASQPQPPMVVVNPYGGGQSREMSIAMGGFPPSPFPQSSLEFHDQPMFADARLANWMLRGLSESP